MRKTLFKIGNDKQKKKKYGLPTSDDDDEAVKAAKLELKRQELKIIDVKNVDAETDDKNQ